MRYLLFVAAVVSVLSAPLATYAADPPTTKIIMLGTGTPRPNTDRSGPATAIVVADRAYLIDFGPGVVRRAAAAAAKGYPAVDPARIKVAFVTHLHSDHTAGYPDLMLMPWIFGRTELDVYGPAGIEEMTEHIRAAYRQDIDIRTKGMEHRQPLIVRAHDVKPGVVYKDELVTVKAFAVAHGEWPQAFGYRFETPDRTIVISGDTSPSAQVIANCQGCDVLIHEVQSPTSNVKTIRNWPAYRARYHTTSDQLAEIANKTRPGLLVLYHNGSDEAGLQEILREIQRTYHGKVAISHDLDVF